MRILICPDKFKGSLSAEQVCEAIEFGIRQGDSLYDIVKLPLADGGEGTLEVLQSALGGEMIELSVLDPLFRPILADYLWIASDQKAFVEMSRASGLALLQSAERNALKTSSYGTGQLILHALEKGAKEIILTVGGSATNDAGIGMAAALGFRFFNHQGEELSPIGENLVHVSQIAPSERLKDFQQINFKVATDVENTLFGLEGAAYVFAAQKGADAVSIKYLDKGLINLATFFDCEHPISQQSGAGAAGGLGAGAMFFLGATKVSGSEMVLEAVDFEQKLAHADFVITGEGKIDSQTWYGKLVAEILKRAQFAEKKCLLVCGIQEDAEKTPEIFQDITVLSVASMAENSSDSMENADRYLKQMFMDQIF